METLYEKASLILNPGVYDTSKVYATKPFDGSGDLTFTRSNDTATRVASNGLIEKVRTNLILQSNSFNTTWYLSGAVLTSGQAGYDGTTNAWLLDKNATQGRVTQSISQSGIQTLSVYAKKGTSEFLRMFVNGPNSSIYFNLNDGSVQSSASIVSGKSTDVGGGWYRCEVAFDGTTTAVNIYPAESGSTAGTSGNVYIQDAQLETGDIATDYIPTTTAAVSVGPVANLPRLNYPINSDGSVGCPSLLLEPQRQNLANWSEDFSQSYWGSATITKNVSVSPDGYINADNLATTSGLGNGLIRIFNINSSTQYVFTIYAKSNGATSFKMRLFDGSTGQANTETKTVNSEWQRFDITRTSGSSTSQLRFDLYDNNGDLLIYGAQFEAGAYATSYIPTLGASVTRGADACSKTGIGSLIGQTEGTLFVDTNKEMDATLERIFSIYSTTSPTFDNITISKTTINTISVGVRKNNVLNAYAPSFTGTIRKLALAYSTASNGLALYVNGTQLFLNTDSGNFSTTLSEIYIGSLRPSISTSDLYNDGINQVLLFKTRLTNQELQDLTTL